MLSTAIAIADASVKAVHDEMVMTAAAIIVEKHNEMTRDEMIDAMFHYSAMLSAVASSLVTEVCLTQSQIDDMLNVIDEMDALEKDTINDN